MNPLTNIKNQQKLNQTELALGLTGKKSWHDQYKDSAWIFIGGLPFDLTEGDILSVFSQYGEIVNINLVRDQKSGKSKGFCFLCYEDQRSTILTVDNLNGIKLLGRMIRVDHVEDYKKPKEHGNEDDITMQLRAEGCAPKVPDSPEEMSSEEEPLQVKVKVKKEKKIKVKKEKKKKKKRQSSSSDSESDSEAERFHKVKVKKEKLDAGYDKALNSGREKFKRSRSPYETAERQKFSKHNRDFSDGDRDRARTYNAERNRERGNRELMSSDDSYSTQGRDGKKNRNKERNYVNRDSDEKLNERFKASDRSYESGRNSRDFERNRNGRDVDRNHESRDFDRNRDGRDFDRNQYGRDFDRNRDGRDFDSNRDGRNYQDRDSEYSGSRKSYRETDRAYSNDRNERVKDRTDSYRERRDKYSDNGRESRR